MMKVKLAFVSVLIFAPFLSAQQPPRSQLPELGRPTKETDDVPAFNFDQYFLGKWTFEWEVPDGVFGSAGTIKGTTVYKPADGRFYEADTEASGPEGAFRMKEIIGYHKENKVLSRHVTDSRGFSFMQIGRIGGDLGGYFNIYYESAPFSFNGRSIRIRSTVRLLSPVAYRVQTTVSVDGGPFMNYANPWWRKDVPGSGK
jgi:hypothetical protein